jgi:hypothetical protein
MISEPIMIFVVIFITARLMALRLPFYSAAVLAIAGMYLVQGLFTSVSIDGFVNRDTAVRLAVAFVLYFLIDRSEKRWVRWTVLVIVAWAVFTYLL